MSAPKVLKRCLSCRADLAHDDYFTNDAGECLCRACFAARLPATNYRRRTAKGSAQPFPDGNECPGALLALTARDGARNEEGIPPRHLGSPGRHERRALPGPPGRPRMELLERQQLHLPA